MHSKFEENPWFSRDSHVELVSCNLHVLRASQFMKSWKCMKFQLHRSSVLFGRFRNGWVFWKVQKLNFLIFWKISHACLMSHILHVHENNQILNNKRWKCSVQNLLAFHHYWHYMNWPIIEHSSYYPTCCLPNLVSIGQLEMEQNNCLLLTMDSWTGNV